jgi:hypothetical protein
MTANAGYEVDVELERLHWVVEVDGRSHLIDLIPGVLGTVAIEVDGRRIGHVPQPAPQRPWREASIEIDGEPVIVAVSFRRPVLHTDVFVGGRSVRDRRALDLARDAAPRALTNYETWVGGAFICGVLWRRPILSRWLAAVGVVSLLTLGVMLIWMSRPSGVLAAAVVAVAMVGLFFAWFVSWTALTTRVHLALLERPELGEARRLAWFTAALLGYPVLSVAVVVTVYGVARTLASS